MSHAYDFYKPNLASEYPVIYTSSLCIFIFLQLLMLFSSVLSSFAKLFFLGILSRNLFLLLFCLRAVKTYQFLFCCIDRISYFVNISPQ